MSRCIRLGHLKVVLRLLSARQSRHEQSAFDRSRAVTANGKWMDAPESTKKCGSVPSSRTLDVVNLFALWCGRLIKTSVSTVMSKNGLSSDTINPISSISSLSATVELLLSVSPLSIPLPSRCGDCDFPLPFSFPFALSLPFPLSLSVRLGDFAQQSFSK